MVRHIPKNILKQTKSIMKPMKKKRNNIINNTERKHTDRLKEYDRAGNQLKVYCPHCNGGIVKRRLNSHLQSQKCKKETASK